MRILMVNTVFTEKNGITNVIMNLVSSITDNNIHFDLLSINEPNQEYRDIIQSRGGKVYVVERRIRHAFKYMMQLKKIIQKNQYDIVHIHANSRLCVLDLMGTMIGGCKVRIVHSHNSTCIYKRIHMLLLPLFELLCTDCLACGKEAGKWMFGNTDFNIIPNGIFLEKSAFDANARQIIRSKYNMENKIVLGNLAGFVKQKNQSFLIDILCELLKTSNRYILLLMGDGATKHRIIEKIDAMGLNDAVVFTGVVDPVAPYLSACDLFIMPSLYEGFPLALVEAQTNGLNCIVSNTITKDIDLTGNLSFLSLNESLEHWANECRLRTISCQAHFEKSLSAITRISDLGYDIQITAKRLATHYKNLVYSG